MNFGEYLKSARLDRGKTQCEFAKRLKTSQSYLSNLEDNKIKPGIKTLRKVADELGVEIKYLRRLLNENNQ